MTKLIAAALSVCFLASAALAQAPVTDDEKKVSQSAGCGILTIPWCILNKMSEMDGKLKNMDVKLGNIDVDTTNIDTKLGTIDTKLTKLNDIENTLNSINARLGAIDTKLTTINSNIERISKVGQLWTLDKNSESGSFLSFNCTNDNNPSCGESHGKAFCQRVGGTFVMWFTKMTHQAPSNSYDVISITCRIS